MKPNITGNGKKILEKDMEHITIRMEIDIKVTGTMIFKMVLELTITPMETFIKENG